MRSIAALLPALALLAACSTTRSAPAESAAASVPSAPARVVLVISRDTDAFSVRDARIASKTSPGVIAAGVLGGAIGAGIAQGIESSKRASTDEKTAASVRIRADGWTPREELAAAFRAALRGRSPATVVDVVERRLAGESADAVVLLVSLEGWGLRRVMPGDGPAFGGFMDVEATAEAGADGRRLWRQRNSAYGPGVHELSRYRADEELLRRELTSAADSAGELLALWLLHGTRGR